MAIGRFVAVAALLEGSAESREQRIVYCRVFITMPSAKLKCKPGGNMISIIYHAREQELEPLLLLLLLPGTLATIYTPRSSWIKKNDVKNK